MISDVRINAELEMAQRLRSGVFAHLACVVIVGTGTPLATEAPVVYYGFAVLMLATCVARLWLVREQLRWVPDRVDEWNRWMTRLLGASSFLWGVLFCLVFEIFGVGAMSSHLVFLLGSGIAAAGTVTHAAHRRRAVTFVVLCLGTPSLWLLTHGDGEALVIGFVCLAYLAFLLAQVSVQGRQYWESMETRELVTAHAGRMQLLFDAIPGYVSWIGADMKYKGVNQNLAKSLKQKSPAELVGKPLGAMSPDSPFVRAVLEFAAGTARESACELLLATEEGERWHIVKMRRGSGDIFLVSIDIHELRMAQDSIASERARTAFAAKMASLGEMASGIGHEINNPLAIITGTTELVRRRIAAGKMEQNDVIANVDKIEKTALRIAKIVKALRSMARDAGQDPMQDTAVETVLGEVLDLCGERFRTHGISLVVSEIPKEGRMLCRPAQIVQALTNLLNNAFDAVEENDVKEVHVDVEVSAEGILIAVSDSGRGVSPELRTRIMEPFFTTKPMGKGTGLGLNISSSIAHAHHGALYLDASSKRTRFVLRIPSSRSMTAAQAA